MTGRALVVCGDALRLPLPDGCVDLIVTSPPFWQLRDYSVVGQIGNEPTRDDFLDQLWQVTAECMRVMKPTASLFVELGDSYSDKSLNLAPQRYAIGCTDRLGLILRAEIIWNRPNGLPESVRDRVRLSHSRWWHFVKQPRYYSAIDEVREPSRIIFTASQNGTDHHARAMAADEGHHRYDVRTNNPLGKLPGSVWTIPSEPLRLPAWLGVNHYAAFPSEWPRRFILGWSPPGICLECEQGRWPVVDKGRLDESRPQARRAQQLAEEAGLTEVHLEALVAQGTSDVGRAAATQTGTGRNRAEMQRLADEAKAVLGGYSREFLLARPSTILGYACACTPHTDHPERRRKDFHAGTDRPTQGMNDGNGGERFRRYQEELANPRGPVREYHLDGWTPPPTRPALVLDPFGGTGTSAGVARQLGRIGISLDLSEPYCRAAKWRVFDSGQFGKAIARTWRERQGTLA